MKNILESFLDALEVRYTKKYADSLYDEHPHRGNMYGLQQMLGVYGIRTLGVYLEEKDLTRLNYPCVLHTGNDFAVALDCDDSRIVSWQRGRKQAFTHEAFRQEWTGNALVVEEAQEAREPDFGLHRREALLSAARSHSLSVLLAMAAVAGLVAHGAALPASALWWLALNGLGLCLCALLLQKQLYGESPYADRVCSLFHQADCDGLLRDGAARVWGFSWSEVGLGYFAAAILVGALCPPAAGVLLGANLAAMAFGLWSIYYQWRVARRWCVLCVAVQAVAWTAGLVALCGAPYFVPTAGTGFWTAWTFAACIVSVHGYAAHRQAERERAGAVQRFRSLKADADVAGALMGRSTHYAVSDADSSILFGNRAARLRITILSNPHCNPCARLHHRVDALLKAHGSDLCVQYVFMAFSERLEDSCRYLISRYDPNDPAGTLRAYAEWYAGGKDRYEDIVATQAERLHTPEVEQEVQKHFHWRRTNGLASTPTILVNGYLLPREYELEDLAMLAGCRIDLPKKNIKLDINGRSTTPLGAESRSAEETV